MPCTWTRILIGACLALILASEQPALGSDAAPPSVPASQEGTDSGSTPDAEPAVPNRVTREGLDIEFSLRPSSGGSEKLIAGDWADVTFRISDETTGNPLSSAFPAAWLDLTEAWAAKGDRVMGCKDRVATYLQGIVGVRPMIDLNTYFLLVMNRDNSISVIDPAVGITGITNLFAQINLEEPAADWIKTEGDKQLFVTMPLADKVALVDTDTFKVTANVEAGARPTRIELQADERYLWVGNNAEEAAMSGVTVIEADGFNRVTFIPTGAGHHEIALTGGDRYAFVSNRGAGTVSVIDVQTLKKITDLETGPTPIALGYSQLSKAVYVADATAGTVTVLDASEPKIIARMEADPGLGPMRFSDDGRWGVVVNPSANRVYVIDAATNRLAHTVPMERRPFHVSFTRSYAYIRLLDSAEVALFPLSQFDRPKTPPATFFPAGQTPPGAVAELSIADSVVPSVKHEAAYVVNQAEGTVHYYMEGGVAPMGAFRNRGHEARAIEIVDRSLAEREPGVYVGQVRLPVEGTYDVAFLMDTPRFVQCFTAVVEPNPETQADAGPMEIEYQIASRYVPEGTDATVRFKLTEGGTGAPRGAIRDVTVMYYGSDGRGRTEVPARALGEGLYEAEIRVPEVGTYYVYVGSRSAQLDYTDLPYASLMGVPTPPPAAAKGKPGEDNAR